MPCRMCGSYTWFGMRQNLPARSFQSLMALLIVLAAGALVLLVIFNPATWLRQLRLSLPAGIHSPLYADYSADLRGMLVAPADLRLLQEALAAQQAQDDTVINDLLTPVPTVTPPAGNVQPTLPVVVVTPPDGGPTATLAPGITPVYTWTPTLTLMPTFTWTPTLAWTPSATLPGGVTRTPGPTATLPPWTPTASLTPTHTASPTATFTPTRTPTSTPSRTPTPTRTPTVTPTNDGYPPPSTPPGYP